MVSLPGSAFFQSPPEVHDPLVSGQLYDHLGLSCRVRVALPLDEELCVVPQMRVLPPIKDTLDYIRLFSRVSGHCVGDSGIPEGCIPFPAEDTLDRVHYLGEPGHSEAYVPLSVGQVLHHG